MAVRQLRRIGPAAGVTLHDQLQSHALHTVYWRKWMDALEREHPELVVQDGDNLVAAEGHGGVKLLYSFESERAFADRFEPLFKQLLPRIRKAFGPGTLRFRLSYFPARPMVEPVLKKLSFAPSRDWLEFTLGKSTRVPAAPAPRGIRFRDGSIDDVDEMARIDRESFPDTPMLPEGMRARIEEGEQVLIATSGRQIAGFCLYSQPDPGEGFIHVLATAAAHRGKGIGAALTTRAAKRLFSDGARDVRLTTDQDNTAAIRLYNGLGFKQTRAGRDYSRPIEEREVERLKKEGILIRFGGWR